MEGRPASPSATQKLAALGAETEVPQSPKSLGSAAARSYENGETASQDGSEAENSYASTLRNLHNSEQKENIKVVIRVRPPLERETDGFRPYQECALVESNEQSIVVSENMPALVDGSEGAGAWPSYRFAFDHVYDQDSEQKPLYHQSAREPVLSVLDGYNAAMIAYGQTGTGKTYTMEGEKSSMEMYGEVVNRAAKASQIAEEGDRVAPKRGIIPRAIEDIFTHIESDKSMDHKYLVRASFLQIYNEVISDLLKPDRTNLSIREDKRRGLFVEGLSEWIARSPSEIYSLMEMGASHRATGSTRLNEVSSRSHAIFQIIIEVSAAEEGEEEDLPGQRRRLRMGKLNLVDLAGSERVRVSRATGQRLEESKKINQSLSALGNVISALTDTKGRAHIPYRDSKLTRILEDSLGGNCKTTMIAAISPSVDSFSESLSTLKFANRAKHIKNTARVNEDLDQRSLLRRYEKELKTLRAELQERQQNLVDKRQLLAVEEEKRQLEEDKVKAIRELQKKNEDFMREKEEKRELEDRIGKMQSQVLSGGGQRIEDTPAFRNKLEEERQRIRREYEERVQELERERMEVEGHKDEKQAPRTEQQQQAPPSDANEDAKQQLRRYKQVVLKQRDIMIALTARLNERDEEIHRLQEELEEYDKNNRKMEDDLDASRAELINLRKAAVEHSHTSPDPSAHRLGSALGAWGPSSSPQSPQLDRAAERILAVSSTGDKEAVKAELEQVRSSAASEQSGPETTADGAREAEVHSSAKEADNERLREENERLKRELNELKQSNLTTKERRTLRRILDEKVKAIARSLLEMAPQEYSNLREEASKLEKLVTKTVNAIDHRPSK